MAHLDRRLSPSEMHVKKINKRIRSGSTDLSKLTGRNQIRNLRICDFDRLLDLLWSIRRSRGRYGFRIAAPRDSFAVWYRAIAQFLAVAIRLTFVFSEHNAWPISCVIARFTRSGPIIANRCKSSLLRPAVPVNRLESWRVTRWSSIENAGLTG